MKTIQIPAEFSPSANNVLKYADTIAQAMKAKLNLLNAYTLSVDKFKMIARGIAEETASAKFYAGKKLKKLCDKYWHIRCSAMVEVGSAVNELVATSVKTKANLIIIGKHGAVGLKKVFFRSNASIVISKSEIPELTIPQW